jgi:hypothetical protein
MMATTMLVAVIGAVLALAGCAGDGDSSMGAGSGSGGAAVESDAGSGAGGAGGAQATGGASGTDAGASGGAGGASSSSGGSGGSTAGAGGAQGTGGAGGSAVSYPTCMDAVGWTPTSTQICEGYDTTTQSTKIQVLPANHNVACAICSPDPSNSSFPNHQECLADASTACVAACSECVFR